MIYVMVDVEADGPISGDEDEDRCQRTSEL